MGVLSYVLIGTRDQGGGMLAVQRVILVVVVPLFKRREGERGDIYV